MKKIDRFVKILCALSLITALASCGNPSAEPQKENVTLKRTLVDLEQRNRELTAKVADLEKEVAQFMETPESMFEKAMKEKQLGKYDEALNLLETLAAKAAGKPVARSAKDEVTIIGKLKQDRLTAEERARRETFQDIGSGFAARKINFRDSHGITEIVGELKNNTGKNLIIAKFVVALYDAEGTLLSNSFIDFTSFPNGSVKTFSAYSDISARKISTCKVQLDKAI